MSVGVNTAKIINNGNQINLLIMLKFVKKQRPKYAYVVNRRFLIPDSKKKLFVIIYVQNLQIHLLLNTDSIMYLQSV